MDVPLEQISEMTISPHYWGIYTSLYNSLPPEAVEQLERAIWLKMSGLANEARAIFDNELKPFAAVPVVAIEHADLELEVGKWGQAWRILNSELSQLREAKEDLESPEHRLMLLTWAMLGTRHRGDVTSSAIEIERTQHWLAVVPVADYTDIQAGCIRRYVIASLFTRLYSGYNNPEVEHIPFHDRKDASGEKIPWGGLQILRRSLTQRSMFNEANALFRVELNRTPPEEREPVVNDFMRAVESIPSSRGRDYIEAVVRLQWATTHIQLQASESAAEEFDKSAAAFQRFCSDFGIRNKEATPHMQAMAYERLSCIDDPIDKLERTEKLAAHMEAVHGTKTGYYLAAAADLSRKYYEVTGMESFKTMYFDVQKRLDTYDRTVSEDICDLVHHHVDLNSFALAGLIDRGKALDWVDAFFKQFKHFDAPVVRALLLRGQASLLRSLRRRDEASKIDEKARQLETSVPPVGNWMHTRQGYRAPTKGDTTSSVQPDPQHQVQDDDGEETFFWGWSDAIGDQVKIQKRAIQLVSKWLLEDIATGNPALEEFRGMTEAAFEAIALPRAVDINELAEERYKRLCAWLRNPPVYQKNRRLFCLVMLRFGRQMHFSDLKLWDLRVSELQSLLELEESLPQIIRDNFPDSKGSWLGQIALTYMAPLDYMADFTSAESGERLSSAQTYNDRALVEYRRKNDLGRVALHQRSGAQICMFMIRRIRQLEQQAASSNDTKDRTADNKPKKAENDNASKIRELRDRGISQAKEADEIFSLSELHASSSSGLEGITHRQSITAANANSYTILTGIELLLDAPGEPSDETITKVWQWVQKYKARSLARTIGVRITDPPELVSKIKACPDAARGYYEMLEMEQRVKEAQGMAKFNLRRQLDTHRRAMRETHDLLRQLLDLKEAQPFDLSDVARITAQSGTPMVLVDWFYLPPYFTGDTGRLLLLTVRERSKRSINIKPTMDMLNTKVADVVAWQKTYLTPEKFKVIQEENLDTDEARKAFDSMLGGLIAPLSRRVKPGELIVLCPSSFLHRLPLHALAIKGYAALIHRNPVVYTHSQSLLRSCFAATDLAQESPGPINAKFISGIAESESRRFEAGRISIQTLARQFRTDPMIDQTASKEEFLKAAGKSRLLHLHTHCGWGSKDPLDHMVEFPMPCAPLEGQRQVERVTAREIFDIHVSPGTHVNMIACQGGVVNVPLGDEVLGLVPALMCSGASSTVSTLWKISDIHGSRFSKLFFDSFTKQSTSTDGNASKAGGSLIVNLAKAMQFAAEAMDHAINDEMDNDKQVPLYRWAGYVLHGCWQFPLSEQDIKSLQNR
ncbi:hypothetical protein FGADI_3670 [Fusarium gaditjirri]|uniref:CHAT domain-containing protein n=1 Tax=Fusarium gaditjirri TaxID=282569 RepID=A0A8H4TF77_9HYPO|nr:hypothetical protein FGADI_3670 [Fusarium gaditjirri]